MKECEFRFRDGDMYQVLLKLFKKEPLKLSRPVLINKGKDDE
jgi:hypothetical protein